MGTKARGKGSKPNPPKARGKGSKPNRAECLASRPNAPRGAIVGECVHEDLGDDDGGYVADALGRTMLLPTDVEELNNMKIQEVFLSAKRYLGMVRLLKPKTLSILAPGFSFMIYLSQLAGYPGHL